MHFSSIPALIEKQPEQESQIFHTRHNYFPVSASLHHTGTAPTPPFIERPQGPCDCAVSMSATEPGCQCVRFRGLCTDWLSRDSELLEGGGCPDVCALSTEVDEAGAS